VRTAHNALTILTIVLTFTFFVLALFFKGLTHDILLEAAVFLISVKVILGMVQIRSMSEMMEKKLEELIDLNSPKESHPPGDDTSS